MMNQISLVIKDLYIIDQSKEEREAKVAKTYLGNCKVVWTNGVFPDKIPYEGGGQPQAKPQPKQ